MSEWSVAGPAFKPAWWCKNPHLQTLVPYFSRRSPRIIYQRERVTLDDGDFLDIDWTGDGERVTVILHGLEGCSQSHYVRGVSASLAAENHRVCVMHFRGCSGEPNALPRRYHAGDTADFNHIVALIRRRMPHADINAVGYSLGGNVLAKWLGEHGASATLQRAAIVCPPLNLSAAAERMQKGVSRIYQWRLIALMRQRLREKARHVVMPIELERLSTWRNFWQFDHKVTAPLHGFESVHDYYRKSSAKPYLTSIHTPTLLIMAADDPLLGPDVIPEKTEISGYIKLEILNGGGHVGFVSGTRPWHPNYWLDERLHDWFDNTV